ncbi:MAG: His-Xaa-Ser system radical SAM maturase HxsC, partial [Candidatus Dadabacteria bacterium]|nr:His-Xaa-Ser system radical SAM maturase HxsC [Candidatus Dadabacteria bacterium]
MKTYKGQATNLRNTILGKVTKSPKGIFKRKDYILVSEDPKTNLWGYRGILTSGSDFERFSSKKPPIVTSLPIDQLAGLNEEDIVLLDPNGEVKVIWDSESISNAIFTTDRCNCSCIMCPQHKLNTCFEEHELNLKLLNLIDPKKTRHIGITGGEPTLLNEKLFELIKICRNKFPDISLSLLTNGRKFKELSFAKKIAEINHPNLIICISLNADTDTEHDYIMGASGSFNETVEGLYNLALLRQKVEIRTVIHSFNYKRLPKLAEFIYHNFPFVVHVALMGMEVTGLSLENIETLWVDPYDYLNELREAVLYLDRRLINVSVY